MFGYKLIKQQDWDDLLTRVKQLENAQLAWERSVAYYRYSTKFSPDKKVSVKAVIDMILGHLRLKLVIPSPTIQPTGKLVPIDKANPNEIIL